MEDWQIVLSPIGPLVLVIVALFTFVWKVWKPYRNDVQTYKDEVEKLRNDVAWVNQDLTEVKKDVEWLVWHFKEKSE